MGNRTRSGSAGRERWVAGDGERLHEPRGVPERVGFTGGCRDRFALGTLVFGIFAAEKRIARRAAWRPEARTTTPAASAFGIAVRVRLGRSWTELSPGAGLRVVNLGACQRSPPVEAAHHQHRPVEEQRGWLTVPGRPH